MPRYQQIRRAELKQQHDRGTWPDIYELMQEITLLGRGMYLMEEPLFFGVAFEEPPFMTYSITSRNEQVSSSDVVTVVHPTEGLLDSGNHRGSLTNKIPDGSFEVFGQNGGVGVNILVVGDQANYFEYNYLPGEDYYKRWTHWMQSGSGAVWVGASDRTQHGNYSVKATLGSEASSTTSASHTTTGAQTINEIFSASSHGYAGRAVGQSFTPGVDGSLRTVKFKIGEQGSPTDSLFAKVSTSMGGTPLGVSDYIDGSSLVSYPSFGWATFTFTNVSLQAGVEYYLWVERSGPVGDWTVDYYFLQRTGGVAGDVYPGGAQFTYMTDDTWEKFDTYPDDYDMIFELELGSGWSVGTKTGDASSRVLIPFHRESHEESLWPVPEDQIFSWYSVVPAEHTNPHHNPAGWKNTVAAHVYAEQSCQLVMRVETGGLAERLGGESTPVPLPTVVNTVTHDVSPGVQQRFEIEYPTPYYDIFCAGNGDYMVSRLELQIINGVPGSSVWIDNVYHSGNLNTETNVLTTVGVAEWVTDEQDQYIGAKLWFRIGDLMPPRCLDAPSLGVV